MITFFLQVKITIYNKVRLFSGTNDISYSVNWAAPELIRGNIKRIDEKTDYYSIGAITYSKIFNSFITSKERSYGFTPDYKNNGYFSHINPRIYKLLTNFFRKTISNNCNRRYQTIDEMIKDLEEMISVADIKSVSLVTVAADQKNHFIGRKKELHQIDEAFNNGKNIVIINGFGGIGKTELALNYYNNHHYYFHTKVWGKCITGLKDLFNDDSVFNLRNVDKTSSEDKIKLISEVTDKNTLIVIDNLDVLKDEYLNILLSLDAKVLITTRARIDSIIENSDTTEIIEIGAIYKEELLELFKIYYSNKKYSSQDEEIMKIIEYLGNLTLMVPIVAKTMVTESISPKDMLSRLESKKLANVSDALIKHYKDNDLVENNAFMQASMLYDLSSLSYEEKEVLFVISMMGDIHISRKYLAWFAGLDKKEFKAADYDYYFFIKSLNKFSKKCPIDVINKLIEKGYLFFDKEYDSVSCHNIIREISLYNTELDIQSIPELTKKLDFIIDKLYSDEVEGNFDSFEGPSLIADSTLEKIPEGARFYFKMLIINILDNLNLNLKYNLNYVLSRFLFVVSCCRDYNFEKGIDRLIPYCTNSKNNKNIIDAINIQFAFNRENWFIEFRKGNENEVIYEGLTNMFSHADQFDEIDKCKYLNIIFSVYYHEFADYLDYREYLQDSYRHKVQNLLIKNIREFECLKDKFHDQLSSENIVEIESYKKKIIEYAPFKIDSIDIYDLDYKADELEKKVIENKGRIMNISKNTENDSDGEKEEDFSFSNCYKSFDEQVSNRIFSSMKGLVYNSHFSDVLNIIRDDENNIEYCLDRSKQFTDKCLMPKPNDLEINAFIDSIYYGSAVIGPSANNDKEYAFEFLCRNKSMQFLDYSLKEYNENIDTKLETILGRVFFISFYNDSLERIIEEVGAPGLYLELLRNSIKKIKKDDLDYGIFDYGDSNYSDLSATCTFYANKYNYKKLSDAARENENNIYNCGIYFDHSKIDERYGFDYEKEIRSISSYLDRIKNNQSEIDVLRNRILNDDSLSVFYKKHLLNSLKPQEVNMFEYYACPIINIKPDNQLVKELIDKKNKNDFKGLEELSNLCELAFQYALISNDYLEKYLCDIIKYITLHPTFNNVFDYMAFSIVYIMIYDYFRLVENDTISICKSMIEFVDFVINEWVYMLLNTFDYYLMDIIRAKLEIIFKSAFLYKDHFEKDEWDIIYDHIEEIFDRFEYLDKTYIGDSHTISYLEENDRQIYEDKCNKLIKAWENEDKTKEEYFGKFKEFFEEVFPDEDWKDY